MTHLYYYITAGLEVDKTSRIYIVKVGHGKQADRDFLFLVAYAADHGHYFELRSETTSEFIMMLHQTLVDDSQMVFVSARDLVRAFKRGENIDRDQESLEQAHRQRIIIDSAYRASCLSKR